MRNADECQAGGHAAGTQSTHITFIYGCGQGPHDLRFVGKASFGRSEEGHEGSGRPEDGAAFK